MNNQNVIDVLIENIKSDQELLISNDKQMEALKEERKEVANRLKGYRTDVIVLMKYADDEHKKQIEALGLDVSEGTSPSMNQVANLVMEIVMNTKDNTITNGALYEEYVKKQKNPEDAVNYTEFNIKCRSLFNTQKLLKTKGLDPSNSREDIVSLNGRVMPKVEPVNEVVAKEKEVPQEKIEPKVGNLKESSNKDKKENAKG